ncbi:hypothetical protein [Nocardia spumae]|uniref:hypothetical protein n=1 Tax=Nocardia spumae TaxID=2887190 RepID=UPI001D140BA6|nr:hypothetical protein [Nocardia spumae]
MDWPHMLRFVGVTVAFSVVLLVILVPRRVKRRLCSTCGHSNIVHDPVSGRCRSAVDAGLLIACEGTGGRQATRCRCRCFLDDERRGGGVGSARQASEQG